MADIKELKPTRVARDSRGASGGGGRETLRDWLAQGFTRVEDVVYIGLGLILAGSALALLADGLIGFGQAILANELTGRVVSLLDRILLILMIVEILYTVQVSFREHALIPEPFLIVGLIAATRRILLLTAEFPKLLEQGEAAFRHAMWELGLLTVMILVLVISVVLLRRRSEKAVAEKA
jgi:uncharacterized membrane protein (DUF373 family)